MWAIDWYTDINDLEWCSSSYFALFHRIPLLYVRVVEDRPIMSAEYRLPLSMEGVDRASADLHRRHVDTCLQCPVTEHSALAQPPTATTSCRVHIASLARGLSQSPHLKFGTGCRPNWKRQPVPLTVLNAPSKHFYFISLPTAMKHALADFLRHRWFCRGRNRNNCCICICICILAKTGPPCLSAIAELLVILRF